MSFQVNGNEPNIVGESCQGFYLIQYQEDGLIKDQANTIFFKFNEHWVQHHFDGNTIFWRESLEPEVPVNNGLASCLTLLNLCEFDGVVDHVLESIEYYASNGCVGTKIKFSSGQKLTFIHHSSDDYTTISC